MSSPSGSITYVPVEQARKMPGLRLALTRGMPGPWSVSARAIFELKGIEFVAVPQELAQANAALKDWTGQTSAPVAMLNDERPRVLWSEILVLAEQLQPEPRLIPQHEDERIAMFGLCHEICGDDGLGWNARLLLFSDQRAAGADQANPMYYKYHSQVGYDHMRGRLSTILSALARRLERQAMAGSRYFVGDRVSAADIYWAAFSNLFDELGPDLCINPPIYQGMGVAVCAHLPEPPAQILIDHREYVMRKYFKIPIVT
jgi:glutathione S-transferase